MSRVRREFSFGRRKTPTLANFSLLFFFVRVGESRRKGRKKKSRKKFPLNLKSKFGKGKWTNKKNFMFIILKSVRCRRCAAADSGTARTGPGSCAACPCGPVALCLSVVSVMNPDVDESCAPTEEVDVRAPAERRVCQVMAKFLSRGPATEGQDGGRTQGWARIRDRILENAGRSPEEVSAIGYIKFQGQSLPAFFSSPKTPRP